jgi:SAM-dependent methyltransferase
MSAAAAFDRIAARYDELWTETPTGRTQRAQVWSHIDPLFRPGDHILDIGCGTGADAAHLLARGINVHAIDTSPSMVAACSIHLAARLKVATALTAEVLAAEKIGALSGTFDGALSNFGVLNCIADLRPAVAGLAARIRPGGYAAICTMGRFCAWETFRFTARLEFRKAIRRWSGVAHASLGVTVYYHTISQIRAAFAPAFELQQWMGIGFFPRLRAAADHRLLIFKRK